MARKRRIWYPGAVYHVMSRGNRRGALFRDKSDFISFLEFLAKIQRDYPFQIHAICLMDNHFHLLLETGEDKVSLIMQKLLHLYASDFNYKYHLSGHLFEGRFVSSIIEDDVYFLEVSRYIHLNPVKANMCNKPSEYCYSSYAFYVNNPMNLNMNDPVNWYLYGIVNTDRVLDYFGGDMGRYRAFVEEEISHEDHELHIRKEIKEDELWLPA